LTKNWVFDLSGNYIVSKNITLFSTVNNLFNNKYIVANLPQGYRPGMPFAINLGVRAQLQIYVASLQQARFSKGR